MADGEQLLDVLTDVVHPNEIMKFEREYLDELQDKKEVSHSTQFNYAWCLVRSKYANDIRKGILLLEELFANNPEGRREYYYYLAVGNARVHEYNIALRYIREFLHVEPNNVQIKALENSVKAKMKKDGITGMAVAGGVVIGIAAGLVGLGMALSKK